MATYVKKQTLYWNANPAHTVNDIGGTGNATLTRSITVAESHDASSATYAGVSVQDDFVSVNGNAELFVEGALQTAAVDGDIAFIRVKASGLRTNIVDTNGQLQPSMAGVPRGTPVALGTTNVAYTFDFTTDPADGLAWTNAKLNAIVLGLYLQAWSVSVTFNRMATARGTEFEVEVWGSAVPETAVITATANDGVGVAGAVATTASEVAVAVDGVDATALGGALTTVVDSAVATVAAADSIENGGDVDNVKGNLDPTVTTVLAASVDSGSALVTLRSNTAPLYDENVNTYASDADGFGVPGTATGTLTVDGHGVATTSIEGLGAIGGVKFCALARGRKDAHVTLSNWRMGGKALLSPPPVGNTSPPYAAFGLVETAVETTDSLGNPWDWATIFSALANDFSLKVDYAFSGGHEFDESVQLDVAEMWCEVWGPVGSAPEIIELRQVFGEHRKTFPMGSQV